MSAKTWLMAALLGSAACGSSKENGHDTDAGADLSGSVDGSSDDASGDGESGPPDGATLVFGYPNGFPTSDVYPPTQGANVLICAATVSGGDITMIPTNGHNHAFIWYATPQPPTPFTTQFSFTPTGLGTSVVQSGMTFMIQNTAVATGGSAGYVGNDYTGDANMCGYGGATNQTPPNDSIAIKFDAGDESAGQNYPTGGFPASTGLYFNGGPSVYPTKSLGLCPENDLNPFGFNFYSGDTYQVTIVYDGSLITMVILDTTSKAQARFEWPLDLANTTNSTSNYVGFTPGTAPQGHFVLHDWSYWSGFNTRLATPSFSPASGQVTSGTKVSIDCPAGAECYYTTNGLAPTSSSTLYTGPVTVNGNEVIQAVAIHAGYTDSLTAAANYRVSGSGVINFPNGFSAGNVVPVGFARLNGSSLRLTDTTGVTAGAAWFPMAVPSTSFTASFALKLSSQAQGMTFTIQNSPAPYTATTNAMTTDNPNHQPYQINWSGGPTALGADSNALGYGGLNAADGPNADGSAWGLRNSVAIAFEVYGVSGDPTNSVGLYTNGADPFGNQIATGLDFGSGDTFDVALSYSGTTLSLTMTDSKTAATFSHDFTNIDIASAVQGNTAYVGFTGGSGGAAGTQDVLSWTLSN